MDIRSSLSICGKEVTGEEHFCKQLSRVGTSWIARGFTRVSNSAFGEPEGGETLLVTDVRSAEDNLSTVEFIS